MIESVWWLGMETICPLVDFHPPKHPASCSWKITGVLLWMIVALFARFHFPDGVL